MGRFEMNGIIIQARMGSTRLPGKVLKKIDDRTLLKYICDRLAILRGNFEIVIATSTKRVDDEIVNLCQDNFIKCFRGSEENVLERYYYCAKENGYENIIRLTADNPFVDVEELDNLAKVHIDRKNDFTYSFTELPLGVGAEIFSFDTLERIYNSSTMRHHFEHVDEYLLENLSLFKTSILDVSESKRHPEVRLTVDTLEDYVKVCYIVNEERYSYITTERAVELCTQYALNHPIKEEWGTFIEV